MDAEPEEDLFPTLVLRVTLDVAPFALKELSLIDSNIRKFLDETLRVIGYDFEVELSRVVALAEEDREIFFSVSNKDSDDTVTFFSTILNRT